MATMVQAKVADDKEFLEVNTGGSQRQMTELCLKVDVMSFSAFGPNGPVSSPIGVKVAANASPSELVVAPDYQTKQCETGYIKIMTTAPLISITNAPVGL